MNKESSPYIFLYSAVLALAAALLLALAATLLKPYQQQNIETEKKQNILGAVRKAQDADRAANKAQYVEAVYARYITSSYVVSSLGAKQDGDAFAVNLAAELHKDPADRSLPVFICTDSGGDMRYIIPMRGQGLWGAVWGYVALCDDLSTIYGAVFDHQGETPGLGAEIASPDFQQQLQGKQIFDLKSSDFTSVHVLKGGGSQGNPHAIDAISGGTITSKSVEKMMHDFFGLYLNFFKEEQRQQTLQLRELKRQQLREAEAEAILQREEARQRWRQQQALRAARALRDSINAAEEAEEVEEVEAQSPTPATDTAPEQ